MSSIKATLRQASRDAGWHSRGYLPHFDGGEIAQTLNLHLADSFPQTVLRAWMNELAKSSPSNMDAVLRRRIERYLDQGYGSCALRDARVAAMVQKSLLHFDGERYRLSAWVVMPNHVHVLLTPDLGMVTVNNHETLEIIHLEANKMLRQTGQFWMEDTLIVTFATPNILITQSFISKTIL